MYHLIFVALAMFTNTQTGETAQGTADVSSLKECAALINSTPYIIDNDGVKWFRTAGKCYVGEVKNEGN